MNFLFKSAVIIALAALPAAMQATPDASWLVTPTYLNLNDAFGGDTIFSGNVKGDVLPVSFTSSADGLSQLVTWAPTGSFDFTSISLKAGNFHITWDVSQINWSQYNGFFVTNDIIMNKPRKAYHEISHIAVEGRAHSVPDEGSSIMMVALGLLAVATTVRRRRTT